MHLVFGAVFRGDVPLVVFSPEQGNYDKLFYDRYRRGALEVGKSFFKADNYFWVIRHDAEGLNIVMAVQNMDDQSALENCIDEIRSRFLRAHSPEWKTAGPHELNTRFEPQFWAIRQIMETQAIESPSGGEISPIESYGNTQLNEINQKSRTAEALIPRKKNGIPRYARISIILSVILVSIYLILALSCGGFDLKPRCISR